MVSLQSTGRFKFLYGFYLSVVFSLINVIYFCYQVMIKENTPINFLYTNCKAEKYISSMPFSLV